MECPECRKEMKRMPYMLTSNPPQDEYKCVCGHIERVTVGTCENHEIKWFGVLNNQFDFAKEIDCEWIGGVDLNNTEDVTIIHKQKDSQS